MDAGMEWYGYLTGETESLPDSDEQLWNSKKKPEHLAMPGLVNSSC